MEQTGGPNISENRKSRKIPFQETISARAQYLRAQKLYN